MNDLSSLQFLARHAPRLQAEFELHPQPLPERFQFLRLLGRGGSGDVWLAWDNALERNVAIKMLRADRLDAAALDMMEEEARRIGRLSSQRRLSRGIVQIHDFVRRDGNGYLVCEYIDGGSLADRVQEFGPLQWPVAVHYLATVAETLAAIHEQGIVHRDVKPQNLLWSIPDDNVLLVDFGLAVHQSEEGTLCGTRGYAAPESRFGHARPESDVFSLGATGFFLLTGDVPFAADTMLESCRRAGIGISGSDPRWRKIPDRVRETLQEALKPAAEQRPSMDEFAKRLRGAAVRTLSETLTTFHRTPVSGDGSLSLFAEVRSREARPISSIQASQGQASVVEARTGDTISVRFQSRSGGCLTVLNIGSSGRTVVFPLGSDGAACRLPPGGGRELTFTLSPPAGSEELVGILTREPAELLPDEWLTKARSGPIAIEAETVYRDLDLIASHAIDQPLECATAPVLIVHT